MFEVDDVVEFTVNEADFANVERGDLGTVRALDEANPGWCWVEPHEPRGKMPKGERWGVQFKFLRLKIRPGARTATILDMAKTLGVTLTEHQVEMAEAVEWLSAMEVEQPAKRGRSTLLMLQAITAAVAKPNTFVPLVAHERFWGRFSAPEDIRHLTLTTRRAVMELWNADLGELRFENDGIRFLPAGKP